MGGFHGTARKLHGWSPKSDVVKADLMEQGAEQTLSILVVEDDEAIAELIRTVLNDEVGWGATVVHSADAARQVLRHVRSEILVIDVNLPGISGLELLTLLRQDPQWHEPPIILMSANDGQPGIRTAVNEGLVTAFLRKPFDPDRLVAEIRAAA